MAVGFGRQGLLVEFNFVNAAIVVCTLTAGSAFLMWIGERITEKGVGNGISIVLLINILYRVPQDLVQLYTQFISGKTLAKGILAAVIILLVTVGSCCICHHSSGWGTQNRGTVLTESTGTEDVRRTVLTYSA